MIEMKIREEEMEALSNNIMDFDNTNRQQNTDAYRGIDQCMYERRV